MWYSQGQLDSTRAPHCQFLQPCIALRPAPTPRSHCLSSNSSTYPAFKLYCSHIHKYPLPPQVLICAPPPSPPPLSRCLQPVCAVKDSKKAHEARVVSFYSPVPPPALPLPPESLSQQQQQHLPRLQALLQQRPVWPTGLLLDQLPGCSEDELKPLLVALCYQFKTGMCLSLCGQGVGEAGLSGGR